MPDMQRVIKGCENWVKNHKDEDLLLAYSAVCELLAILKEQDNLIEVAYNKGFTDGQSNMLEAISEGR